MPESVLTSDCLPVPEMTEVLLGFGGKDSPQQLAGRRKGWGASGTPVKYKEVLVLELPAAQANMVLHPDYARPANRDIQREHVRTTGADYGGSHYWGDVENLQAMKDRIAEGWPAGVEKVHKLTEKIAGRVPMAKRRKRKPSWAEQGDEVDMNRVYGGQLDRAWRSTTKESVEGFKIISIDVDVGHNSNINAEDLFWAGATAIALTDALEEQGYRVELYATQVTDNRSGQAVLTRMVVKKANEHMNLHTVAALVALPASFRCLGLNSWTRAPWFIGYAFGQSAHMEEILEAAVERGVLEASDLQITNALSEAAAIAALEAGLHKIMASAEFSL